MTVWHVLSTSLYVTEDTRARVDLVTVWQVLSTIPNQAFAILVLLRFFFFDRATEVCVYVNNDFRNLDFIVRIMSYVELRKIRLIQCGFFLIFECDRAINIYIVKHNFAVD